MRIFKIVAVFVSYLSIGLLEAYCYYMFKAEELGVFGFLTLMGFIATFGVVISGDD